MLAIVKLSVCHQSTNAVSFGIYTMTRSRVFLFSGLFIAGALILFHANGTVNLNVYERTWISVEKSVEPEIIADFELKTWNRSKSIGFLRK